MIDKNKLILAWKDLEWSPVYCLRGGGVFIIESPDIEDDDLPERTCTLRVFLKPEDARVYQEQAQIWFDGMPLHVMRFSIKQLFEEINGIQLSATMDHGCPASIHLSKAIVEEHPETIDVLYNPFAAIN